MQKQDLFSRVQEALADGPQSSTQLVERLGIDSSRLTELYKAGKVGRTEDKPYQYFNLSASAGSGQVKVDSKPSATASTGPSLADLLQDTAPLEGERRAKNLPLPVALQNELRRVALHQQAEYGLEAPDQCDYLAVGTLLLLRILEEGGGTADQLWEILRGQRLKTRARQGNKPKD